MLISRLLEIRYAKTYFATIIVYAPAEPSFIWYMMLMLSRRYVAVIFATPSPMPLFYHLLPRAAGFRAVI